MTKFNKENWYKEFFSKYYLRFFGRKKTLLKTKMEAKFIYSVLNLKKGAKILDLACGFGRHAIELAKKGLDVTCLDFNKNFLNLAQKLARRNRVSLRVVQSDMRVIPYKNEFDAIISMFSSFGYFEKEKENLKVLKAVSKAFKTEGFFLLDLPNKNWVLTRVNRKSKHSVGNFCILEKRSFNNKKKIYFNNITIIAPGKKIEYTSTLMHLYDLSQIKKNLNKIGFKILKVYGDYKKGRFNRTNSRRMIIIAQLK